MIRLATESDLPALLELSEEFYNLTPYSKYIEYSPTKAAETILSVMSLEQKDGIVLVLDKDGVKGVLAAVLTETFCSSERIATELIWYVKPEARTREAFDLHTAFNTWCSMLGVKLQAMSDIKGGSILEKFYSRNGYSPVETTYVKVN